MPRLFFGFLTIGVLLPLFAFSQSSFTLNGYVRDASSGEDLIGATVTIKERSGTGTTTNVYGFYSLTLAPGDYTFTFSYLGYQAVEKTISLKANQTLSVELTSGEVELQEVIVSADRPDANVQDVAMSREKLQIEKVQRLPALFGEVDIIKTVQLLPGVISAGEGTTGLFVRGGSADQNLVLLDGATVYNPSHFLGFFSVFNPDAIKNIEIYKGGIPARFGSRLSSILDIQMKEGNSKKFRVSGGIGLISSRLTVEGPIKKDQSSFILSGRRTYADLFLRLSPDEDIRDNILYFYDFNAKANYTLNDRNRLFLSGYFGRDKFGIADQFGLDWGNATATLRWNHLLSDKVFFNTTLVYSNFDYGFDIDAETAEFTWTSRLKEYSAKFDGNFFASPNLAIDFGYHISHFDFEPARIIPQGEGLNFVPLILDNKYALEHAVYIGNNHQLSPRISMEYGLRYSYFQHIGPGTVLQYEEGQPLSDETISGETQYDRLENIESYHGAEPRFGMRYLLDSEKSLKFSYNRMRQYVQIASNATAGLPIDRWIPADTYVPPMVGDQLALGYFQNLRQNTIEASVEVYYKWMHDIIDFLTGTDILLNENLETEISVGRGWAYGAEFLLRKDVGRTTGWIAYTLSRVRQQIDGINLGQPYNARYDRTHDIALVLSHQLNPRLTLSGNWVYSTGTAVSFPSGRYQLNGLSVPYYGEGERNAFRMPDYHRFDVSVVLENKNNEERRWKSNWSFSVYNVYGRKNPFVITFEDVYNDDVSFDPGADDEPITTQRPGSIKTYLFRFIPSITYNFKF
ncbi:TonB-dependent receptor [Tunicatimonas pelagia]|uniref:TonB-dependent receptor n=1 Tax=Tunicatimonas pelagia TaxID=931531 RepID=UPI0026671BB7|nr:TonB-dependent receptor [Tunicatimonas pelagia]WKN41924.1 TonB-dependent receptor [Tunicatimonas pelagia]